MEYDELQTYIAQRIRQCRKERKLSQEKLSEIAGLGAKAIQNIENEKYDFKIQTLSKILKALDISVEEFFDFPYERNVSLESLHQSLLTLPSEKQKQILSLFNDILKQLQD